MVSLTKQILMFVEGNTGRVAVRIAVSKIISFQGAVFQKLNLMNYIILLLIDNDI